MFYFSHKRKTRINYRIYIQQMTKRAFILGLTFVIIQSAITPYNNFYIQGTKIAGNHFPLGSVLVLLVLTLGLNTILRRVRPESELSAGELIVVWMMLVISSGIPGKD